MGRHSSDDSESRGRSRRSRSYDRSDSRVRIDHKKSRQKHHSPSSSRRRKSRSISSEESPRTSRSRNVTGKRRSRSRSSRDRSHSSRSKISGLKHKHRSSRRSRSRSVSQSKHSVRSRSKRSRSRSSEHSNSSDSEDSRSQSSRKPTSIKSQPSSASLEYLSNAEKAEAKLQMAIKAAAAADETLKNQGHLAIRKLDSMEDQQKRANAIEEIDSVGFTQTAFRSTRSEIPMPKGSAADASHAGAMFGTSSLAIADSKKPLNSSHNAYSSVVDRDSIMHPFLFVTCEEKMDRWKKKLTEMREIRLQETGGKIP